MEIWARGRLPLRRGQGLPDGRQRHGPPRGLLRRARPRPLPLGDPIGHEGGLNLYAYCGDSPLLRSDASGLDWVTNTANLFGGWGHSLTFGLTGRLAQGINNALGNGDFQCGGGYFVAGEALGTVNQIGLGVAGGVRLGVGRLAGRLAPEAAAGAQALRSLPFPAAWSTELAVYLLERHTVGGIKSAGKSLFQSGTSLRTMRAMIREAVTHGQTTVIDGAYYTFYDFGRAIGHAADGTASSVMKVYTQGGIVRSAYPVVR